MIPAVGPATLYPSTINVTGLPSSVTDVNVELRAFSHSGPSDVDVLLVGPGGQSVILMSDAADSGPCSVASNVNLSLDDEAATPIGTGALLSGTYRPKNYGTGQCGNVPDDFPSPAPAGPYGAALTVFDGANPNGLWSLYVVDDTAEFSGSFAGSWSLDIFATGPPPPPPPPPPPDLPPPPPPDTTAPETTIVSGPLKTDKSRVKFGFASSEAGSTFQCRLTGKKVTKREQKQYGPCTSKKLYMGLKPGKYKFFVFATDAAGNADPTAAVKKLKIVE